VFAFAEEAGLQPILTPDDVRDPGFAAQLAEFQADVFVIVAYRILPESVFAIPTFGTLNVHASLLPQYRGPAPIQRAIEHGEQRTGVTVFRIDRGVDTGGVLLQRSLAIGPEETTPELYQQIGRASCRERV